MKRLLPLLALLSSAPALADPVIANFPPKTPGGLTSISTSAPVSGDGTSGTPVTIANGAVALTKLATQATVTVVANATGGTASPTAVALGAGLAFSGGTLVNSAPWGADTTIQLTGSGGAVSARQDLTTLVNATAGSERTDATVKLREAGALVTALYARSDGWLGVGPSGVVNLNSRAVGNVGMTFVAATTNQADIEFKKTTASSTTGTIGQLSGFNGTTNVAAMLFSANGSTTAGQTRFFNEAGAGLIETMTLTATSVELRTAAVNLSRAASQTLYKTGTGNLDFGTNINSTLSLVTNGSGRMSITGAGLITMASDVVFSSTVTLSQTQAAGAQALTTLNGPTATGGGDPDVYLKVLVGATTYVVAGWAI